MSRRRPPGPYGAEWVIVWGAFLIATALILLGLGLYTKAAKAVTSAIIPGTVSLVIVNPPEPASCDSPGLTVIYVATGQASRAKRIRYYYPPGAMVVEVVPALVECVFADGFEEG